MSDEWHYPQDWPRCPVCEAPALDGHLTCGQLTCDEHGARRAANEAYQEAIAEPAPVPCAGCRKPTTFGQLCDDCACDGI